MIDGEVFLGRNPENGNSLTTSGILTHLDSFGLDAAIVTSYRSIYFDYLEGNEEVIAASKACPGKIIPSLYLPPFGISFDSSEQYLRQMFSRGAKVLSFPQRPCYYPLQLESLGNRMIAEQAAKLGYVLQFALNSQADLFKVADYYCHLPCPVLVRWTNGRGYFFIPEIVAAIKKHSNLAVECGAISSIDGISHLVDQVGASRLYFATGAPESIPYCGAFMQLGYELTSLGQKLAESNALSRFYSLPTSKGASFERSSAASLYESVRREPKIDTHCHIDSWNLIPASHSSARLAQLAKDQNYKAAIISSALALNYDLEKGNANTEKAVESEKWLYGYIVVDPTKVDESIRQIERYGKHPKFVGLKTIQDLYGLKLDAPEYRAIFDANDDLRLPILAHMPGIMRAADNYPSLKFVCAHATWLRVNHMLQQPNLYFDLPTSIASAAETQLDRLIEATGGTRILFGSDAHFIDPCWTLAKVAAYGFDNRIIRSVLFENALIVFDKLQVSSKF